MKRTILWPLLLVLVCFSSVASFAEDAASLQKRTEALFESSKNVNSKDAKVKAKARADMDNALDWDKVAEDALGSANWKKQSQKNRNDFKNLLKEVIVRTAYTRMDKFWDGATYKFDKVEAKDGKGHVVARFNVKQDSYVLDYYFHSKGGKWFIYDLAFEGERYSVNINEQISAFLGEKSFANLLDKLKKRRDELASETGTPKKG
jgi:ABC-type transporter MlaC component